MTDELIHEVDESYMKKRHFMISDISDKFPQTSRTSLLQNVTEKLGYKFCTQWVPKQLNDNTDKTQGMVSAMTFYLYYWDERDKFLDRNVTRDQT